MIKIFKPTTPFLVVQNSFWPFCVSLCFFSRFFSLIPILLTDSSSSLSFLIPFFTLLFVSFLWLKDLSRERILGYHTHKLEVRLRIGVILFIVSEVFFFFSFFWAFFDSSLAPSIELGNQWPPLGITPLPLFSVPLLNTVLLLSRGVTITLAHHSLIANLYKKTIFRLSVTIFLGYYFLSMQGLEYLEAPFSIADRVYGSTFFITTGFHGFHVFVGATYLLLVLVSLFDFKFLYNHHFIFESAAWYWHFVDVVWLFLFISIYWWGAL